MNPFSEWPLRVIMIGGSRTLRAALSAMVRKDPGFCLVGEADTASEALTQVFRWQPAVVLIDACLPDCSGFDVVEHVRELTPSCASIILSGSVDACVEEVASVVGARAVWHKGTGVGQLRRIMRCIIQEAFFRPVLV